MSNESLNPSSLTTNGRLVAYSDSLKTGLQHGIEFTKLFDQLTDTKDANELLEASTALFDFQMDTEYVVYPHKYNANDYYLIFMSRLLELHSDKDAVLHSREDNLKADTLYQTFPNIDDKEEFHFEQRANQDGAFYVEQNSHQVIFSLNLEEKTMYFNSDTITKLFITEWSDKSDKDEVTNAVDLFIQFGKYLVSDFDFSVDFNMLDASNDKKYILANTNLSEQIMDKLFVATADNNLMLQNMDAAQGAFLELGNNIVFSLYKETTEDGTGRWVITVHDPEEQYSLFEIFNQFSFLKKWFLDNIDELQIGSKMV
ncbi:Hypothetical protein ADU72_1971 [Pediococcus damnosus]|uniref:Uncharacterized protein n=2 Tax=Pediococcus damnosus TaxID=51663 RepID=A0A0R2H3I4_9LACO|nr:hypothetical protein [Pediococcus damnosus]AMV61394.1 Hypothetical protein ADU69_1747 [Pediococcus damnosus]AMV62249.1 Hypothetical protein ADU70_0751 [Pediococcus damnosus]AMV65754.1 Hypothetical protein ADU71_1868 [Pediococcus damnosus]AMV67892.1 Hypothetical protein ADU72_1971 [Pediococcus damnosus]KRN47440.1 hypothetical protein IV84_GL001831 [Pediococcus damnosus]